MKSILPAFLALLLCSTAIHSTHAQLWDSSAVWTLVNGAPAGNYPPNYGSTGIPAASNLPPACLRVSTWTDLSGNLWFFGGYMTVDNNTQVPSNQLWKYDRSIHQWTFMGPANKQLDYRQYGTREQAADDNWPGARYHALSWTDSHGNFWLWGGEGLASNEVGGTLSDLWMYNSLTNQWTWVSGSNLSYNGRFSPNPELGTGDNKPYPGARTSCFGWMDKNDNIWISGGTKDITFRMNDLWKYNIAAGDWTEVQSQTGTTGDPTFGTQQVPSANNQPPGLVDAYTWTAPDNSLWMFGGEGMKYPYNGYFDDVWRYNITSNEWTWMRGSGLNTAIPQYEGAVAENSPGARWGSAGVADFNGNFFIYGGFTAVAIDRSVFFTPKGDFWKYNSQNNEWLWLRGDSANPQLSSSGKWSTRLDNDPGARSTPALWYPADEEWYMMGGETDFTTSFFRQNDLWKLTRKQRWFYIDTDGDGFGAATDSSYGLVAPPGYVIPGTDCDNSNATIFPGAPEVCDGFDNDCNGLIDDNCRAVPQGFTVVVTPNPSSTEFHLEVLYEEPHSLFELTVSDLFGNIVLKKRRINYNELAVFGNDFKPGIYFAEVVSLNGRGRQIVKLIKTP